MARTFMTHALIFVLFCYIRAFLDEGTRPVTDSTCRPTPACHLGLDGDAKARGRGWTTCLPVSVGSGPGASFPPALRRVPRLHPQAPRPRPGLGSPANPGTSGIWLRNRPSRARKYSLPPPRREPPAGLQTRLRGPRRRGWGGAAGRGPVRDVNALVTQRRCGLRGKVNSGRGDDGLVCRTVSLRTTSRCLIKEAVGGPRTSRASKAC